MLDSTRFEKFIEQVRLTPAIWKNVDYGIEKAHLDEIWQHFGHTFDISATEAEEQWRYLIRLHRFMNKNIEEKNFRIHQKIDENEWDLADSLVADALNGYFKQKLDYLLLISKLTESEV